MGGSEMGRSKMGGREMRGGEIVGLLGVRGSVAAQKGSVQSCLLAFSTACFSSVHVLRDLKTRERSCLFEV